MSLPSECKQPEREHPETLHAGTRHLLLRRLATEQADGRAPSLVAAVAREGRSVWAAGRGRVVGPRADSARADSARADSARADSARADGARADGARGSSGEKVEGARPGPDTQYRIGSITKTFTAVLVMRLRDEGRLALADPLDRHLPGTAVGDRTIADLLSHLAGITAETPPPWWERVAGTEHPDLADVIGPGPHRFRPGRRHHYSNVGFAVLGALVAHKRATSWAQAMRDELLTPLGLTRTTLLPVAPHAQGYAVHPHADVLLPEPAHDAGVMAPAGQLWSTTTDLVRWSAVLGGHTDAVLSLDTVAEMREPAAVEGDSGQWQLGAGLGLQLIRRDGEVFVGHGGSMPGFVAALWGRPVGTTAVALANTTSGVAAGDLALDLVDLLDTLQPPLPTEWLPSGPAGREALDLTGVWYWGPAPYMVSLRADGGLLLAPLGRFGRPSRLRAGSGRGTWTGTDGYFAGETLTPRRDAAGAVTHLELASFVFTRAPYAPPGPIPGGLDPRGWR
ncbi:beta-lactamase family protein [Frankia sp. AiPa1]|uniref:serine hydrolase domain-containing protein n=1 Tax=Frankia sp. AiPa1 TaxID=573492 RepID=UPI00202AF451|nr:beta-lactamase family protein [Frankia sp. AiPa1]MCL9761188.1 beta-lactamase family protein [Frankia sp. AiPa1]